jgi:hypothetical protein
MTNKALPSIARLRPTWAYRVFLPPAGGGGVDSRITLWQIRHSKVSNSAKFSRDLLACMAIRQTGQWRMRGRDVIDNPSPKTAARQLIQINADSAARRRAGGIAAVARCDLGQGAC